MVVQALTMLTCVGRDQLFSVCFLYCLFLSSPTIVLKDVNPVPVPVLQLLSVRLSSVNDHDHDDVFVNLKEVWYSEKQEKQCRWIDQVGQVSGRYAIGPRAIGRLPLPTRHRTAPRRHQTTKK